MKTHEQKLKTSMRLSQEAKRLLSECARRLSVSQSAIVELAIRAYADGLLCKTLPGNAEHIVVNLNGIDPKHLDATRIIQELTPAINESQRRRRIY